MKIKSLVLDSIKFYLTATIVCGGVYTVFVYGVGKLLFGSKVEGSLMVKNNTVVGSSLIGQKFTAKKYFQSRPSAIDNNPAPSGASNLSWTSKDLQDQFNARKKQFILDNSLTEAAAVPSDMLFASGSGVDPHISVEAAKMQINRVVKERSMPTGAGERIADLIDTLAESSFFTSNWGKFVNTNMLNLKLDELSVQYAK